MAISKLLFCLSVISIAYGDCDNVGKLWPQGTICYRYDLSITESLQNVIRQAMDVWENATCLNFESSSDNDCVVFYSYPNEEYCTSSSIGRGCGQQNVTLGYSCRSVGRVLYTLGLTIGLHTEQNRHDRNRYVRILKDNIEECQEGSFDIYCDLATGYQGVGYNYASIMHLSASAYSTGGQVTTEIVNHGEYEAQGSPKLGNRQGLSRGDVLKANRLYNCPGAGRCEDLRVNIGSVRDLATKQAASYWLEVVGVDSEGRAQNLSSTVKVSGSPGTVVSLTWNETLQFPINTAKWQFFRIAVKSEDKLLSMMETVSIENGRSALFYRNVVTPLGTAKLSYSYECVADGDDCDPDPCVSATGCTDELFGYTCDCREGFGGKNCNIHCPRGYSGYSCSVDISGNSCTPNPCIHGNTDDCTDGFFDYTCSCCTGFGGKNCEVECPRGYSGRNCEHDISGDSCRPTPCHSSHSLGCLDHVYNYTCSCIPGFGGRNCERPCQHGYGGFNCDVDVTGDSCLSSPCHAVNSISCADGFFDYTCGCRTGYGGKNCEITCPRGYDGYNCNVDISGDSCNPNPCHSHNTRTCVDGFFDYTCNCRGGYGGNTCSTDLCASGLCNNNGGLCVPYRISPNYKCNCPLAWTPASHCANWEPRCLQVVIKYARGLSDRDGWFKGDSDPYTTITAYTSDSRYSVSGRTRFIQGDESPNWNHKFNAGCGRSWDRFYFRIYDSDVGSDDTLSSGQTVYLKSLSNLPTCRLTVNVRGGSGTITFDVYYYLQSGTGSPGSC